MSRRVYGYLYECKCVEEMPYEKYIRFYAVDCGRPFRTKLEGEPIWLYPILLDEKCLACLRSDK